MLQYNLKAQLKLDWLPPVFFLCRFFFLLAVVDKVKKESPKPPRRSTTTIKQEKADAPITNKRVSGPKSRQRVSSNASLDDESSLSSSSQPKKEPKVNMKDLRDFCRDANIAISQNTKSRGPRFEDDNGHTKSMYRYGIAQILKLFCPAG